MSDAEPLRIAYTVGCTFSDSEVAERWLAWLRDEHLAEVIAAGAAAASAVRMDGKPIRCEARYVFASRGDFDRYEREQAPTLRAAGLVEFPLELGLTYDRSVGVMVAAIESEIDSVAD